MKLPELDILHRLGQGESIEAVCQAAEISREQFDQLWKQAAARRVPATEGVVDCPIGGSARIERDEWGIPHIHAESDADLFFAYGYAMAQDRLFQLDYLRRKGAGRLSEILGERGLEQDVVARTVGLNRIAADEWKGLPNETRDVLTAFTAGVNAVIDTLGDHPPIEFDLLDYRPEPWSPVDCLTIENEFRWYLTGRFPVIAIPELAKRTLGETALLDDFLLGEADDECIMPPEGSSPSSTASGMEPIARVMGGPDEGVGSNNWVVSGKHTASGAPMVASDPHIAIDAVSCWYEVHLCGGSYDVVGMSYVGMPAVMFGRNQKVAWSITNNICSQRDLYQEQTDDAHPGCFRFGDQWEPAREIVETIGVRDGDSIDKTIRFSRNGPIVDEILPEPARSTGPVALKWVGAVGGGWLTSLLAMNRADSASAFQEALRPWHVPTFTLLFADTDGHIGYKASGRLPGRKQFERGYRRGWDPEDQWQGLIPFESMPEATDPERGWIASANNRVCADDDFPYPLGGTWTRGHRQQRIREMFEERMGAGRKITRDDFRAMHQDSVSVRAIDCLPSLCELLSQDTDDRVAAAVDLLSSWDRRVEPDAVGPTIFNVFFSFWTRAVVDERFDESVADFVAMGAESCAARLLAADPHDWFTNSNREQLIRKTFSRTLNYLSDRFGANMSEWTWGKLHVLTMPHFLNGHGSLGELLNQGGVGVKGDMGTVCNTGSGVDWTAATGAGYRLVAELTERSQGLWAIDGQSQSGHPGSPHYRDQLGNWLAGQYHYIPMTGQPAKVRLELVPGTGTE